nr:MAG TPA: hypothetical protein [Caudoviricetes sp.]
MTTRIFFNYTRSIIKQEIISKNTCFLFRAVL